MYVAEEFNKKVKNQELTEEAMKSLHDDAEMLCNLHLRADAEHKVPVCEELVGTINKSE